MCQNRHDIAIVQGQPELTSVGDIYACVYNSHHGDCLCEGNGNARLHIYRSPDLSFRAYLIN